MENKKMINAAKNFSTIVNIMSKLFLVFSLIFVVIFFNALLSSEAMPAGAQLNLNLDFIKIYFKDTSVLEPSTMKYVVLIASFGGIILCAMIQYISKQLQCILNPIKEGRPFEENTPKYFKKIAYSILAGGFILEILSTIRRMILANILPIKEILTSSLIDKTEYSFMINLDFIVLAMVILFLSYIFAYGQKLQQESDETL